MSRKRSVTWPSQQYKLWLETSNLPLPPLLGTGTRHQHRIGAEETKLQLQGKIEHASKYWMRSNSLSHYIHNAKSKEMLTSLWQHDPCTKQLSLRSHLRNPGKQRTRRSSHSVLTKFESIIRNPPNTAQSSCIIPTYPSPKKQVQWMDKHGCTSHGLKMSYDASASQNRSTNYSFNSDVTPPPSPIQLRSLLTLKVYQL